MPLESLPQIKSEIILLYESVNLCAFAISLNKHVCVLSHIVGTVGDKKQMPSVKVDVPVNKVMVCLWEKELKSA